MVTWGNIACKAPWSMITIGPRGELKLCCSTHEYASHISKQDSLLDWFNGDYYNEVRSKFIDKIWPTACKICKKSVEQNHTPSRDFPYFANLPTRNNVELEIKYPLALEFTPSNLCNQTCAMCGSNFSSKWYSHDKRAVEEGLIWRGNQPMIMVRSLLLKGTWTSSPWQRVALRRVLRRWALRSRKIIWRSCLNSLVNRFCVSTGTTLVNAPWLVPPNEHCQG